MPIPAKNPVGRPAMPERIRLLNAQAEKIELGNRLARGELVEAATVAESWKRALSGLRSRFLGLSGRLQQSLPHLTRHDVGIIDREIRDILTEIGEDDGEL